MIASAHVAAGAVVGALAIRLPAPAVVRLAVAMVVGITLHLAMDAIPHSDYAFIEIGRIPWVGLGEALVACGVVALLARRRLRAGGAFTLLVAVASSMAPDVKFVARVLAPRYESAITNITDKVHGWHAIQPLHVFIAFSGEVILALGFFYLFWRLVKAGSAPRRARGTA
jgi:hypothetical protein